MKKLNHFFEGRKAYGAILLRLIIGWRLIAGVWPYVCQSKPISEVKDIFATLHLPLPLLSAYLSIYAQFICAVLLIIGLWVRPAAVIMIINFTVAIIAAHLHESIKDSFPAWVILAACLFFLFYGAGKASADDYLHTRTQKSLREGN